MTVKRKEFDTEFGRVSVTSESLEAISLCEAAPVLLAESKKQVEWLKHIKPQIRNKHIVMGIEQGIKYFNAAISKAAGAA